MVNAVLMQELQVGFKGSIIPLRKSVASYVAIPWTMPGREAMSNGYDIDEVQEAVRTIEQASASIDVSTRKIGASLDVLAERVATRAAGQDKADRPIAHYVKLARQELDIAS